MIIKILYVLTRTINFFSISCLRGFRNRVYSKLLSTKNCQVGNNVFISLPHYNKNANISVGLNCCIGTNTMIDYSGGISILDEVTISDNVMLYTHTHSIHDQNLCWKELPVRFSSLEIGNYAWICSNVIILENVNYIGKFSVVGAGAVVSRDVPDYAIVVGNPAKVIGYRKVNK